MPLRDTLPLPPNRKIEHPGRPRIIALDVLRGFALCGILLANIQPITAVNNAAIPETSTSTGADWWGLLVYQRFFPIFSVLFGVGFSLLLHSAGDRTARPRLLLLRRLLMLLVIGLAHLLLWPGEILAVYAVVGLVVLLPSSWLPRWAVACLAAGLIGVALAFGNGAHMLSPGLFLLGSALTRYKVIDRIEKSTRVPALLALVFAACAVPAVWWQINGPEGTVWSAGAGLLLAGAYVCGLLVLLRTPMRSVLRRVFAPLGKMALTNYLSATVLVLASTQFIDAPPNTWSAATVCGVAGAVLAVQWLWSTLWLTHFRYGPTEYLWRWATWTTRPPLRRNA